MPLDIDQGFDQIKTKVQSSQTYVEQKAKYDKLTKKTGDSFEKAQQDVTEQLEQAKKQVQAYKKQAKNLFEQLLDISKLTNGQGGNTARYLKRTFLRVLVKIQPEINALIINEIINALGCDQQQTYGPQTIYVSLKSIDLAGSLKIEPGTKLGRIFYEGDAIVIQSRPFSMNKELYERIQSPISYAADYGQNYLGASGQPLFDIQYFDVNPVTGIPGGWFGVTLINRVNNINIVVQFLKDYFQTIKLFDYKNILANIMDSLCGAVSIEGGFGFSQNSEITKLSLFIQRVLGLCFDSAREIDASGISKLSELDNIDNSFFDLTEIDLRKIDAKVQNIMDGVVEFEDCDNVKLPVNSAQITDLLAGMSFIEDIKELEVAGDDLTNTLNSNPNWGGFQFNSNLKVAIDLDFVKLLVEGIIRSILSPKVLLPLITMFKAISTAATANTADTIKTFSDFFKKFRKMAINLISKIGGLFVRELFELIKKDLFRLIQSIVADLAKEKANQKLIIILKLVQILLVVIQFVEDWRSCRSVVDEILKLLTIATNGVSLQIPSPLLYLSKFLDGYSSTRAYIKTIEELQKLGISTDDMPDGSPNLDLLARFGQLKAQSEESAENGKLNAVSNPGVWFPNGTTSGAPVDGKSL